MTNEPSPRPWRVSDGFLDRYSTGHRDIVDAKGELVVVRVSSADAALIVDAVNQIENARGIARTVINEYAELAAERDRLRDIVRRLADLTDSLIANYEYRYRDDQNSMAFVGNVRDFIREAREAIGEGAK